jgi:hypothetical protein
MLFVLRTASVLLEQLFTCVQEYYLHVNALAL